MPNNNYIQSNHETAMLLFFTVIWLSPHGQPLNTTSSCVNESEPSERVNEIIKWVVECFFCISKKQDRRKWDITNWLSNLNLFIANNIVWLLLKRTEIAKRKPNCNQNLITWNTCIYKPRSQTRSTFNPS